MPEREGSFLLGVDVEDVRTMVENGKTYAERVPANMQRFFEFFERHGVRTTFFFVGDVARRYPDLVREALQHGHEIASHGSEHIPLDRLGPDRFRRDVEQSLADLAAAGADRVLGFRAPTASLVAETQWAYEILAEYGFTYSSSVLAARNPLYGWPGFGTDFRRMDSGIWELPISLTSLPALNIPFCGGVYFRVLPLVLVRALFRREFARGRPVLGYIHPYDVDVEQEHFMHPELDGNRFYNELMYLNRSRVFTRIEKLLAAGATICPYADYLDRYLTE